MSKAFDPRSQFLSDEARAQLTDDQRIDRYALGLDDGSKIEQSIVNPDKVFNPKSPGAHLMTNPEFSFFSGNQELISAAKGRFERDRESDMQMRQDEADALKVREANELQAAKDAARLAKEGRRQSVLAASRSSRQRLSDQNVARLNAAKGSVLSGNALRSRGISRSGSGVSNFQNISDSVLG